jgi:hypothetical protein
VALPVERADGGRKTATAELTRGDSSQELLLTGFGFTFPPGAKRVTGIVVSVVRSSEDGDIRDGSVRLYWGGFPRASATPKTSRWPERAETATYGAATDPWSDEIDLEKVSSPDFGVAISATSPSSTDDAHIDDVYMTVHYCQ